MLKRKRKVYLAMNTTDSKNPIEMIEFGDTYICIERWW